MALEMDNWGYNPCKWSYNPTSKRDRGPPCRVGKKNCVHIQSSKAYDISSACTESWNQRRSDSLGFDDFCSF